MKLKYEFVTNFVAGKTVAVAVGKVLNEFGGFIKLNDTGAFIFELLKKEISEEEIVNALLKEYDVTEEKARESTKEFLEYLSSKGVI
ncbi:MAG: PqqD family protein [Clostridia bacterium]|nr:PqqD family protein [Clostridia bacterium]